MPVEIMPPGSLGAFALTSTPAKPEPEPDKAIVAKVMSYADRDVIVTYPFPDTIVLEASVTNEIQSVPDGSGKPVKAIYEELDQLLCDHIKAVPMAAGCGVTLVKLIAHLPRKVATFAIEIGPQQTAFFTLSRRKGKGVDFWVWRAKLEFSASQAKTEGLAKIEAGIDQVTHFDFDRLLSAFRIARLDVAIDCIGVEPIDLIAHAPKVGKRLAYFGDKGQVETLYLFGKKSLPKTPVPKGSSTVGPQRLTLYERRAQYRQHGLKPPYGPAPVTRIEVKTKWKHPRPTLSALPEIKNRLAERKVAYAAAVPNKHDDRWHDFCLAAFAQGPEVTSHNPYSPSRIAMAKSYIGCVGDLVDPSSWLGWQAGLIPTGLLDWVERAKKST